MTINIAKSMNSVLKNAHVLLITLLVEFYRKTLYKWFQQRQELASACIAYLTTWAVEEVEERVETSWSMIVHIIDIHRYEVQDGVKNAVVDMKASSYTCRMFDLD